VAVRRVVLAGRAQRVLWEQSLLPWALRRARVDLFHSPHHSLPLLRSGWRTVVTVHDVTFRLMPRRYTPARRLYMRAVTALAARRADAVIVPTRSVAADFRRLYGGLAGRVFVVPEAAPPAMRPIEDQALLDEARRRLRLPGRFVLSVGTLEPGKNRATLLRALAWLRRWGLPHALVIAGQRGWGDAVPERLAAALGVSDRVWYLGYVSDADLPLLYNLAEAFVFPSWREGFGLPPLEAMACGTPVVASDRPAMPEVLGEAALYAPPGDARAIAAALARVLSDGALWDELRRRGLAQAARYSWARTARETLAVYRWVLRR
jgi:glycosyltransferase involved in cell wall biosynthesis